MLKSSDKFSDIRITAEILKPVGAFKAIAARGKSGHTLSKADHEALVHKKYEEGRSAKDHVTIFRVKDKKSFAQTKESEHLVQGPLWSPPSSVAFVMGAQSKRLRVWSATKIDDDGLTGTKGTPAILARELSIAIMQGWMAREPQLKEKYGQTSRGPHVVFTPPSSPRYIPINAGQKIIDVNSSWSDLPMSKQELVTAAEALPKDITDWLKKHRLHRIDYDDALLCDFISENPELIEKLMQKFRIEHVIALYTEDRGMFATFATDKVLCFLDTHDDEIDAEQMLDIYRNDRKLFENLIEDDENLLNDLEVVDFIKRYRDAQKALDELDQDDPYYGYHSAYSVLRNKIAEDGCPAELLRNDSDSENDEDEYNVHYYTPNYYIDNANSDISESLSDDFDIYTELISIF